MTSFSDKINAYFDLTNRSSSILQEVRAGVTCFLTMSYILLVNPQVLSKVGILPTDIGRYVTLMFVVLFMIYDLRFTIYDLRYNSVWCVVVATSLSAGVGTLFVGLFGYIITPKEI